MLYYNFVSWDTQYSRQAKPTEYRVGALLCWFVKAPRDILSLAPLLQESLFHRSIMDLGFCNVVLVKEENTR